MSKTEVKHTENKTKDILVSVHCAMCNHETKHRVLVSVDEEGKSYDKSEKFGVDWANHYQIIQCQGCETISFRHVHWFSEDENLFAGNDGSTERLYPKRSEKYISPKNFNNLPSELTCIYIELVDCYNNDCPALCAAGLRILVEGICMHQGVVDGPVQVSEKGGGMHTVRKDNLEGRINGLHEKGTLTQINAETLHEHRFLGNTAVHELARPSVAELKPAIDVVERTIEYIYEFPKKAEELKRAISDRKVNV